MDFETSKQAVKKAKTLFGELVKILENRLSKKEN